MVPNRYDGFVRFLPLIFQRSVLFAFDCANKEREIKLKKNPNTNFFINSILQQVTMLIRLKIIDYQV
jgi:hypothetical protein